MARPVTDPALVAEGVALVRAGASTAEAAAALRAAGKRISQRTIERALGPGGAGAVQPIAPPKAPAPPTIAAGSPVERLRAYAAHDPEALLVLADLLSEDESPDGISTLERVRKLIKRVERRALEAKEGRFGTLAGVLDRLYARERLLLGPPPARPDAVLEELRRLEALAIAKIEEHLPDPIDPKELQ